MVGTLDFFATETLTLSESRIAALRNTAFLVSQAVQRIRVITTIQGDAGNVVESLAAIGAIVDQINQTQTMISGVLADQATVTRGIIGSNA